MKTNSAAILLVVLVIFLSGCTIPTPPPSDSGTEPAPQTAPLAPIAPPAKPVAAPAPQEEYSGVNENAAIYESLAEAGLENALVDFQKEKILVSLELPEGYGEKSTAYFVLGLTSALARPEQQITVELITAEGNASYSVLASKAQAYANGTLTEQQFESAVKKTG
ncbi:MAG: hypothetical protein HY917_02695 [Candidatus Diapherotrites archaeon]|nr:hypothetical protein [Candidatus Diapherotrites archaeon]